MVTFVQRKHINTPPVKRIPGPESLERPKKINLREAHSMQVTKRSAKTFFSEGEDDARIFSCPFSIWSGQPVAAATAAVAASHRPHTGSNTWSVTPSREENVPNWPRYFLLDSRWGFFPISSFSRVFGFWLFSFSPFFFFVSFDAGLEARRWRRNPSLFLRRTGFGHF